ncbi:MAG: SDR family oxidoreductase [Bacteroidetes bacterium]|nr:SDR family oxidoreductase [Bacteroidota bacterium]
MQTLKGQKAVVTGGSQGLGLGIVEALVAQGALVTVVARDPQRLDAVSKRLGVSIIQGDVTDEKLAHKVLQEVRPAVLVLNAGETPPMAALHEYSWEDFTRVWEVDVKAGFHWLQEAIRLPLPQGSRVIVGSSGAAVNGSPLSGSYAGAKRMLWFMADYANGVAKSLGLDIHFQAIVPMQIVGDTALGRKAIEVYAERRGVSVETVAAGFGAPMPPRKVGEHVVSILTESKYETGLAFGMKGDLGIVPLDK